MKVLCGKFLNTLVPKRYGGICNGVKYLTNSAKTKTNFNLQQLKSENLPIRLWEYVLPSTIQASKINTVEDWQHIRDKLIQEEEHITPMTVDSIILNFCIKMKNYSLAHSYLEFLKLANFKLNLATLGKYFKVFYLLNVDKMIDRKEEDHVFEMYKEIRKNYNVLDPLTCENLIIALSLTKHWQEGLKLLDEIKVSYPPNSLVYGALVVSAFKNNDCTLAWNLLEEMLDLNRTPPDFIYSSYIKNCKNLKGEFMKNLEILFDFFHLNYVECNSEVALKLIETCQEFKVSITRTTVTNSGLCLKCQHKLQKFNLEEQDFEKLKQAIFEKIIIGKNVFYKTTPTEVERFINFVKNMKKYDVVVDGLNVAYSVGTKQSGNILSKLVIAVIRHFIDQNKKVLVLGRTHMTKWSNWNQVTSYADTFLIQSLSQDDPYLLYCALNCGLNTIIVTRDLMRGHLFKLKDPHLKIMFSHWLNQNQFQVQYVNNQGKVFFKQPLPFLKTTQKNNNFWHVPYSEDNVTKWLCIHS